MLGFSPSARLRWFSEMAAGVHQILLLSSTMAAFWLVTWTNQGGLTAMAEENSTASGDSSTTMEYSTLTDPETCTVKQQWLALHNCLTNHLFCHPEFSCQRIQNDSMKHRCICIAGRRQCVCVYESCRCSRSSLLCHNNTCLCFSEEAVSGLDPPVAKGQGAHVAAVSHKDKLTWASIGCVATLLAVGLLLMVFIGAQRKKKENGKSTLERQDSALRKLKRMCSSFTAHNEVYPGLGSFDRSCETTEGACDDVDSLAVELRNGNFHPQNSYPLASLGSGDMDSLDPVVLYNPSYSPGSFGSAEVVSVSQHGADRGCHADNLSSAMHSTCPRKQLTRSHSPITSRSFEAPVSTFLVKYKDACEPEKAGVVEESQPSPENEGRDTELSEDL